MSCDRRRRRRRREEKRGGEKRRGRMGRRKEREGGMRIELKSQYFLHPMMVLWSIDDSEGDGLRCVTIYTFPTYSIIFY